MHALALAGLLVPAAAACGESQDTPVAAEEESRAAVELRDSAGALTFSLALTAAGDRCAIDGARPLEVAADPAGDDAALHLLDPDGDAVVLTYGAGPAGPEIRDGGGRTLARVADAGARFAVLAPDGVAAFRVTNAEAEAVILDRASVPVARVAREGGRTVAKSRDGAILAYVLGTEDLRLAAILAAEAAPWEQRALLGCARLLAGASS